MVELYTYECLGVFIACRLWICDKAIKLFTPFLKICTKFGKL